MSDEFKSPLYFEYELHNKSLDDDIMELVDIMYDEICEMCAYYHIPVAYDLVADIVFRVLLYQHIKRRKHE